MFAIIAWAVDVIPLMRYFFFTTHHQGKSNMDWHSVITDLERAGMTQTAIGERVGCSQGQISDLKSGRRGKRLDFVIGTKLQELWKETCDSASADSA